MAVKTECKNTGFRSLPYRSGNIYNMVTKCLYDQSKKFMTIAKLIGRGSISVMDLPCGTGYLARFLDYDITYTGYDLNHRFLKKILSDWRKGRINLRKMVLRQIDIFDFDKYPKEKQDVIILCDIIHHVYDKGSNKHLELVENAKKHAKKVIICEPVAVKPDQINAKNFLGRWTMRVTKHFPDKIIKYLDFFLADNDGINSYDKRSDWQHDPTSLMNFYNKLGFNKIYNLDDDYIGIWEQ
ncbi:MAG: class I SAM-dependent methyltransferase [Promethearchaeota archaeon]|nr:MAG: class I SAM-dependent methyltransferase [Candidatus Lokiarchaeota archaeon]